MLLAENCTEIRLQKPCVNVKAGGRYMARKIVVTSGKGGVGKTTICANLGLALAKKSLRVLLMDLDIGLNNLDVVMQVEDKVVFDFVDVVENRCRPSQALIQDANEPTLYVMPNCHLAKRQITADAVKKVVDRLSDTFDFVLIDCPAGIEQGFENAVAGADRAIVVAVPEVSSVRDADRIIGLLLKHGIEDVRLVVNRIRQKMVDEGNMLSIEDMLDILSVPLIGAVPDDESIIVAANNGSPCVTVPRSKAGQAYKNIALRVTGETRDLIDLSERKGIMRRLLEVIGK